MFLKNVPELKFWSVPAMQMPQKVGTSGKLIRYYKLVHAVKACNEIIHALRKPLLFSMMVFLHSKCGTEAKSDATLNHKNVYLH